MRNRFSENSEWPLFSCYRLESERALSLPLPHPSLSPSLSHSLSLSVSVCLSVSLSLSVVQLIDSDLRLTLCWFCRPLWKHVLQCLDN